MTAETATRENVRYSGVAGLIIGLVASISYGLITIGPIRLDNVMGSLDSTLIPAGLFMAALIIGVVNLEGHYLYARNFRVDNADFDPKCTPPSNFMTALALGMAPVIIGTLAYAIGCWIGWWG